MPVMENFNITDLWGKTVQIFRLVHSLAAIQMRSCYTVLPTNNLTCLFTYLGVFMTAPMPQP